MCVIIAKPAGMLMPGFDTLQAAWDTNPDGAGVAVADGRSMRIYKGCMTWDALRAQLEQLDATHDLQSCGVLLHCRIATHGDICGSLTHPFKVSKTVALAHNGIIPNMDEHTAHDCSDTLAYVRRIVRPLAQSLDVMHDKAAHNVLDLTRGTSRLALLHASGEIVRYGDWHTIEGVHYSNTHFMHRYSYGTTYYSGRGGQLVQAGRICGSTEALCDLLPYKYCKHCELCEECIEWGPYCNDSAEAADVAQACGTPADYASNDALADAWALWGSEQSAYYGL